MREKRDGREETASKWQQLLHDATTNHLSLPRHSNRFRHIRSRLFYDYFLSTSQSTPAKVKVSLLRMAE